MTCEVNYCIYNEDSLCKMKEIQINPLGMCEKCIIISIHDDILKELKKR